jgi:hypothetical protein
MSNRGREPPLSDDEELALSLSKERLPLYQRFLLGEKVVEGFYRGEFVVFDVEDGVELGDLQDVVNFLGEAVKLKFAAGVADRGKAADQFADAGGVNVIDLGEVEDNLFLAGGDELTNGVAKLSGFVAEGDATDEVEDGDVADFARGDGHRFVSSFGFSFGDTPSR